LVNFKVEPTRVGQKTDYDKLLITVRTDGSISPDDALSEAGLILREHANILVKQDSREDNSSFCDDNSEKGSTIDEHLNMRIDDLELSIRSANCIKKMGLKYVGELVQKTEEDMLRIPSFGRKSLDEIKAVLVAMGLSFGMGNNDWSPEQVEEFNKRR